MEPLITFLDTDDDVITAQTVVHGASAEEIYALISNPRRHHELDGSGTVRRQVKGPEHPGVGEKTTQHMRMFGIPYRMTSTVTRAEPGRAFAWRMPTGHLWSWEILPASVTGAGEGHGHEGAGLIIRETFDASQARLFGLPLAGLFRLNGAFTRNREGIAKSLARMHRRFSRSEGAGGAE